MPASVSSNSPTPQCDLDFFADDALIDPVRAYHTMLAEGPVVWLPRNGLFAVCGYDALTSALRQHQVFQSGHGVSINDDINAFLIGSTLNSDPPAHDKTRAITYGVLTPKSLHQVEDRVRDEAVKIVEGALQKGTCNAVSDLASRLPLAIVRDLVGLGDHGKENMLRWAGATFELMGDPRDRSDVALQNMQDLRAFLADEEVLEHLHPSGWAKRATKLAIDAGMPPSKAVSLMRDYIAPSLDTTISAIGYGVWLFARHPEQWQMLREDRQLLGNAIEEIVRLNTPIKMLSRYVAQDIEFFGARLPRGSRAMMMFGAANRDAEKFPSPDDFDITRRTRGHVGFGHGVHACLGMHLARLEMRCLFEALANRVQRFHLTGAPVMAKNSAIHSFKNLPIRIEAANSNA